MLPILVRLILDQIEEIRLTARKFCFNKISLLDFGSEKSYELILMKLTLPILTAAAILFVGSASAFDPDDLQKLKNNNAFKSCDLSGADLALADLTGASLDSAILLEANLRGANLSGASLWLANLTDAYLMDAYLQGTILMEANLSGASLLNANLTDVNLSGASLKDADLSAADLMLI